jgi:hypothetical protein
VLVFQQGNQVGLGLLDLSRLVLRQSDLRSRHKAGSLLGNTQWVELLLFEQFGQALAALNALFGLASRSLENCAKASQFAELGKRQLKTAETLFTALVCAAPPTRDTDKPTEIAGGYPGRKG